MGSQKYVCPVRPQDTCAELTPAGRKRDHYCFKSCSPKLGASDCPAGVACDPYPWRLFNIRNRAVCLRPMCTKNSDCAYTTGVTCDTSNMLCPAGQTCRSLGTGKTAGECTAPGACDVKSGLCGRRPKGKAGAKVGDPCKGDLDCADNMTCWTGSRNGYCTTKGCIFGATLTMAACDSGSICNTLYMSGLCQKKCDLTKASTCRGQASDRLGDYECRAWSNLSIGGRPVVKAPVCDFGQQMSCDMLQNSSLDCSSVGLKNNATNMSCRDLKNKKLTNKYDPKGYCLDDTASGKVGP